MNGKPETPKNYDPFELWRGMRDAGMDAWAKMMTQTVNTEAYAQATGAMLEAYLAASAPAREAFAAGMAAALQQMNFPTRADVLGLAERLTNIEMRLDDLDAKLDAALQRMRKRRADEGGPGGRWRPLRLPSRRFADYGKMDESLRTLMRVSTTKARIGQTPKEVVWTLNKARLYRYTPVVPAERRHPVPLLLVFALMNRPSILDLRPGHSFVEYMVKHGYDVYLLDWGAPGLEDRNLKFDDYVLEYMPRAIRKMKVISGSREFSLLGWCIGAILTTMYAALRPNDGLRNLLLLTAPLDYSNRNAISFSRWVDERYLDVDKILATFGNMPAEMIEYGAKALKPVENYIGNYLRLWDNLDNPKVVESWHAMNTWVTDNIPMAGGVFRQLIVDLYRGNKLMEGTMTLRGETVDLSKIRANLLDVIAEADHITPPCQSESIMSKVGSQDKEVLPGEGRAHRHHGGQRRGQAHLAARGGVARGDVRSSSKDAFPVDSLRVPMAKPPGRPRRERETPSAPRGCEGAKEAAGPPSAARRPGGTCGPLPSRRRPSPPSRRPVKPGRATVFAYPRRDPSPGARCRSSPCPPSAGRAWEFRARP